MELTPLGVGKMANEQISMVVTNVAGIRKEFNKVIK